MKINQRMKLIRTTEGFTQSEFAELIGVANDAAMRQIESGKTKEVGSAKIERICQRFPEYALWLTTGQVDLPNQISPYLAKTDQHIIDAAVRYKRIIKGVDK